MSLDARVAELAAKYLPIAAEILKEAIRIPADYVNDKDPKCGTSNHEEPRLRYLRDAIIKYKAVEDEKDVYFDDFGSLYWTVSDPSDGIPLDKKKVVYFDGHTDTVNALRSEWPKRVGEGLDAYNGLVDIEKADYERLQKELGYIPPKDQWDNLIFGRGSADQLAGVVSQILATKIMLELRPEGALRGIIIRSYGTIAEEDNDGGSPMYICKHVLPGKGPEYIPDAVIYTEGTGDSRVELGSLGIYRGQRGRMQIEVEVIGKSCHGSMPWEGRNPLEAGSLIIAEAAEQYKKRETFKDHPFLEHGTRTASWCHLDTPSDCAVPERFVFRFDRRITLGEDPEQCVKDIDGMKSVAEARKNGFIVNVRVPTYELPSWKGVKLNNPQVYRPWVTPEDHPCIRAVVDAYKGVVSPNIVEGKTSRIPKTPRVSRWIFSTDGVGFNEPADPSKAGVTIPESKHWISDGLITHPGMFGIGAGFEQNTHKIGENVDTRELQHAIAVLARFPSRLFENSQ